LTVGLRDFIKKTDRQLLEKPFLPSDVRRLVVELTVAGKKDGVPNAP
jgi:hypothetical protein